MICSFGPAGVPFGVSVTGEVGDVGCVADLAVGTLEGLEELDGRPPPELLEKNEYARRVPAGVGTNRRKLIMSVSQAMVG